MNPVVIDTNCLLQITPTVAENVVMLILNQENVQLVDPHFRMGIITADPDDNKFVDCAFAAGADYLVSEDSHFRVLHDTPFPQLTSRRESFKNNSFPTRETYFFPPGHPMRMGPAESFPAGVTKEPSPCYTGCYARGRGGRRQSRRGGMLKFVRRCEEMQIMSQIIRIFTAE